MKCIIDKLNNTVHNLKQSLIATTEKEPSMTVLCVTLTKLGITDLETTLKNQLLVSGKTNSYRLFHLPEQIKS
jgi:hypothetical protein